MFDDDVFTQKKLKGCDYVFCAVEKKSLTLLEEIYTMTVFSVYSLC